MGHGGSAGEHCRHRPMQCEGRKGHQKGHAGSQGAGEDLGGHCEGRGCGLNQGEGQ